MKTSNRDPLARMRQQVESLIKKSYKCVEEFARIRKINRATLSNFLNQKKDFQISTLVKISSALGKQLEVKMAD